MCDILVLTLKWKESDIMRKVLILAVVLACIFGVTAVADTRIGGTCGDSCEWSLDLGSGVLTISGTGAMEDYNFAGLNIVRQPWYEYKNNVLSVVIEEGITSIGEFAFCQMRSMTKVTFPDTLTLLGEECFAYCVSLEKIALPDGIVDIPDNAFRICSSLKEAVLPKNLTRVGGLAFFGCEKLEQVCFYQSKCYIDASAFRDCTNLTIVGYQKSTARTYSQTNDLAFIDIVTGLPVDNTKCGDNAYWFLDETSGILTISGSGKMYDYTYEPGKNDVSPWEGKKSKIKAVIIEDGITHIGDYAFYYASNLESASIPYSVTELGNCAFYYCGALYNIYLPSSIKTIGEFAFGYCDSLPNISLPEGIEVIETDLFVGCDSLVSFTVPSTVTTIKLGAFAYCDNLKSLYMPTSVNKIESYVFSDMKEIITLYVPYGSYSEKYAKKNGMTYVATDTGVVRGTSLVLDGSIGVKTYFDIADYEEVVFLSVIYDDGEILREIPCEYGYDSKKGLAYSIVHVPPKDAKRLGITLKNYHDGEYFYCDVGTVSDIIDTMQNLANSDNSEFADAIELINATKEYVNSAYRFFNLVEEAEGTVNTDFSVSTEAPSREGAVAGTEYLYASLVLEERITIRHYFRISGRVPTFELDGLALVPQTEESDIYYVDIPNIPAHELDKQYVLNVSDSMTVSFSALNYVQLALPSEDAKLRELAVALYNYWSAAENYRAISK